ncbi:MAG TPA: glucoamylase family protein [Terracidiphilus sp.]|nr:glucoamylase family protein [Terracidiphilus sp.]
MKDLSALVNDADNISAISRREMLRSLAAAAGGILLPQIGFARAQWQTTGADDAFLDDLERKGCLFFWDQGSPQTGQILDRARNDLTGGRDPRRMASIASTGFGLTALCIADQRGYLPRQHVMERVRTTLRWHLNKMPEVHGFFYHFTDIETGKRWARSELSSIDTAILLCGILTAKAYFDDAEIKSLAQQIYERVDWPWFLNGGLAFSMGWWPEGGFMPARWNHYCELMMIYLLAMGSPTHPVPPEVWNSFSRPRTRYHGFEYISSGDPIFTHQYSHAWFDFRQKRDAFADYFENSVLATRAHEAFCLSFPEWYSKDFWGVTSSDSEHGYTSWGGTTGKAHMDGTVVPCATAGSLVFLPQDCLAVLRALRLRWGKRVWGRYGFIDAFHPAANWYDPDVIGIDQGISVVMGENLRSGLVWKIFMSNEDCARGMQLAGFTRENRYHTPALRG